MGSARFIQNHKHDPGKELSVFGQERGFLLIGRSVAEVVRVMGVPDVSVSC
ncbi:MAG: hypothetical protein U9N40_02040 [Euryarchaeota archaeon]|nr:hypothetical protein [Euryarchaeota archaeon]